MLNRLCARARTISVSAFLLMVVLSCPLTSRAQNATISGTVTDPSHAPVSSVAVTARNTATNTLHSEVTNDDGLYRLVDVPPGQYDLTFEKSGFKLAKFSAITVTVGQVLTVDHSLEIGSVTETIEVAASVVPPIELENAQISNLVDSKRISDLPLVTRDPYQLVLLS